MDALLGTHTIDSLPTKPILYHFRRNGSIEEEEKERRNGVLCLPARSGPFACVAGYAPRHSLAAAVAPSSSGLCPPVWFGSVLLFVSSINNFKFFIVPPIQLDTLLNLIRLRPLHYFNLYPNFKI